MVKTNYISAYRAMRIILNIWFINAIICVFWGWLNWETGGFSRGEATLVVLSWITPFFIPPVATIASMIAKAVTTDRVITSNQGNIDVIAGPLVERSSHLDFLP